MSDSGESGTELAEGQALSRLEAAVDRLLKDRAAAIDRARAAEARAEELGAHLKAAAEDGSDPVALREAVSKLQIQNADLRERIGVGREGVERLLSRIRFLEQRR